VAFDTIIRRAMPSARAFQQAMDIVKHWWLRSLQVNDQYALTDCARRDLMRCCSAYTSKQEWQERGAAHLHVMLWRAPAGYMELPRVITHRLHAQAAAFQDALTCGSPPCVSCPRLCSGWEAQRATDALELSSLASGKIVGAPCTL
jgi:hypothetical protein